jgi:hypothetical protein
MAKRFHDTEIWRQDWFIELPFEYMLLWFYIKDTCDHAGIWKPHKKYIEQITGKSIDLKIAIKLLNNDEKKRIRILKTGRWFIEDFIKFQYGESLNPNNRVHLSIIKILTDNHISLTSIRGLIDLKDRVKDKDMDKDMSLIRIEEAKMKECLEQQLLKWWGKKGGMGWGTLQKFIDLIKKYSEKEVFDAIEKAADANACNYSYVVGILEKHGKKPKPTNGTTTKSAMAVAREKGLI